MTYSLSDSLLKKQTEYFDFDNPPIDPMVLYNELKDSMIRFGAIGLAANQVGIPYSVFVMGNPRNPDDIMGFFNPKILATSGDLVTLKETSASFPGFKVPVPRFEVIRFRATNAENKTDTETFRGISSRVFQQQMSHLLGRTMFDELGPASKDLYLRKWNKMKKLYATGNTI